MRKLSILIIVLTAAVVTNFAFMFFDRKLRREAEYRCLQLAQKGLPAAAPFQIQSGLFGAHPTVEFTHNKITTRIHCSNGGHQILPNRYP
jgi:hypothetical protein